ncbi:MAG: HsdR family type I site-specific deoxyribonuclease [Nitrososphaerota archaeon]
MSEFSELPRALIPEWADVEEVKKKLKDLGWENGEFYGLTEDTLLENFVHDGVFEEKFNELNENNLKDLTEAEKREVLDHVKTVIKNATEEKLLDYLKYGIEFTVKRSEKRIFRLIDFENIRNNSFVYGWEIKFPGSPRNVKPDFTLFINGLPLAIIEVKPSTRIDSVDEAIEQIRRYEQESPELFRFTQLGIAYGDRKLFLPTFPNWSKKLRLIPANPWKIEKKEGEITVKEESIDHLLKPQVLLDVIKWLTFFREYLGEIDKVIGRYNQYSATQKAMERIRDYLNGGKLKHGLIWHWQGSGKTLTMFFIGNRFFEEYFERNPLIFFIIDRRDLQKQLKDFLNALKAPKFKNYLKIIESIEELKDEIIRIKRSEYQHNIITKGIYIVLIQKFKREDFEDLLLELGNEYLNHLQQTNKNEYQKIAEELNSLTSEDKRKKLIELGSIQKREILLLIDEAHRSQYGLLASMMKNVFKNAIRFAFTGTPVFNFERNTFLEFAYPPKEFYLDVYFIKDSINDNFTLPIVYDVVQEGQLKTEGIKILLEDEDIKKYIEYWLESSTEGSAADDIENILETGEAPETLPERIVITKGEIRQHLNKVRVFLTNEKRLEKLAEYIAQRIEADTENFRYKAMIVTANREACVHIKKYLDRQLQKIYAPTYGAEEVKKWTEIVMTYQHNDTGAILEYKEELFKRKGKTDTNEINLDIQREFKEKDNPKILIVTDMLITGFDAPKLKVMYLDKPLYEHRLLQAIARVNRPYKDEISEKKFGLIIDSVGLLKYVKESLRKFELIAEKRIIIDVEENLLGNIENKIQEFKENLKNAKNFLKTLKIQERNLNIDVDELKNDIKIDRQRALQKLTQVVDHKTRIIAALWNTVEAQTLLNILKETIYQFKALGSHPEKIHYVEDIAILTYIYGKTLYYIKGGKVPKEFWEGLIELIHEKTLVEDFRTIIKTKVDNEALKKALKIMKESISARELVKEPAIADAYRMLRILLEMDPANPIYKAIHERIEKAREAWITRNIDATTFLHILTKSIEEKIKYDEETASKPVTDRIIETVNLLLNQEFKIEQPLNLEELRKALKEAAKAAKIVTYHENMIRTALMKDLFKEVKKQKENFNQIIQNLKDFAKEVTREYIIKEIEKTQKTGGYAA